MIRTARHVLLALVLMAAAAACGQKPGVSAQAVNAGGGTGGTGTGATGTGATARTGAGATPAGTGGGTVAGGTGATGDAGASGGAAGDAGAAAGDAGATGGAAGPAGPGDRTGITDSEIVIGIHAPVTGAAPIPQNSFDAGKDIYFQFVNETKGGIHNRKVRVVFRNDEFNPQTAVRVCKEMVEQEKAFLLVGGGGSDQIGACARYAAGAGVPYLSAGVQEAGLSDLTNYFALAMTYSQQSPLLADLVAKQYAGKSVALLVADNSSLDDYFASQLAALQARGINPSPAKRIPKTTSQTDALSIATEIRDKDVVVWNASPVSLINVAQATAGQGGNPIYVGPGLTNGLNTVAEVGCPGVAGATFFSPFPQLDVIDQMDPDFRPAYEKYAGKAPDDLGIALWGLDKLIAAGFELAGPDMSRQSFISTLEQGQPLQTGVFPPVQYQGSHFGGTAVHVLQADCSSSPGKYKTIGQNVSAF
ncbi:MAG: branched-chain amino acid transport system substrate-binding protein [Acidimicrobiaceae bacterium]